MTDLQKLTIKLAVQARELFQITDPTEEDINKYCTLSEEGKTPEPGIKLAHFESEVGPNQKVAWVGSSNNLDYKIIVESIVHERHKKDTLSDSEKTNKNFFNRVAICRRNQKLETQIKSDLQENDLSIYSIHFKIEKDDESKLYSIDPRLKMRSTIAKDQ